MKTRLSRTITYVHRDGESRMETRPLLLSTFRRLFRYARPYAATRNWLVVLVVPDSVAMLIARTWWAGGDVHVTCDVLLGPIVGTIPIEREPLAMNAGSR